MWQHPNNHEPARFRYLSNSRNHGHSFGGVGLWPAGLKVHRGIDSGRIFCACGTIYDSPGMDVAKQMVIAHLVPTPISRLRGRNSNASFATGTT